MSKKSTIILLSVFITFIFIKCTNKKSDINIYTFIVNMDSIEFYKYPLKNRDDLKLLTIDNFNAKEFIKKFEINKKDSILIKMVEAVECVPKADSISYLLKKEGLENVIKQKFNENENNILGYKNYILFDTTKTIELNVPKD